MYKISTKCNLLFLPFFVKKVVMSGSAGLFPAMKSLFGASLSEPHTSELNGGFFIYIYYVSAVRTSFRKCRLTLLITNLIEFFGA